MTAILNITNGSCSQHVMQQAGIKGEIVTWDDVLHEGPVPASMTLPELSAVRARFIADQGQGSYDEVLDKFITRDNALMSFRDYDVLYLWFEHDLYDQLQLIQILNWLATQDLRGSNIQLICEPCYLGVISASEMSALFSKAKPLSYEQISTATTAWQAFTLPTPEQWFQLLKQDTKCLPFLEGAVLRLLQEYPYFHSGLSLTQQQVLMSIKQRPRSPNQIFSSYQQNEERRFMGDSTFWGYLAQMVLCDPPLINVLDGQRLVLTHSSTQQLAITEYGEAVLAGDKSYPGLASINRWIGGVHLTDKNMWCWDEQNRAVMKINVTLPKTIEI